LSDVLIGAARGGCTPLRIVVSDHDRVHNHLLCNRHADAKGWNWHSLIWYHRQWQGQSLILSDLPDLMQNSIRKMHLDVPLEMAKILLPDSQMSVLDFVEVVLPPVYEDTDQASYNHPSGWLTPRSEC